MWSTLIVLLICLQGCSAQGDKELLVTLQNEQKTEDTVIGYMTSSYLEFLDFSQRDKVEPKRIPPGNYHRSNTNDRAWSQHSSDGRVAMSDAKRCSVYAKSGTLETSFKNEHIVTPLYWSPDSSLLLFVKDPVKLRLPLRCNFDDEHDVVVYEPSSGKEMVITTVCGGYPYSEFRWYTTRNFPSP